MDKDKEITLIIFIWVLGTFFSMMSLLNTKIRESNESGKPCCTNRLLTALEFLSHGAISGVVSVTVFGLVQHYYINVSVFLAGSIAVVAGMVSDTIIETIKRRISEDD